MPCKSLVLVAILALNLSLGVESSPENAWILPKNPDDINELPQIKVNNTLIEKNKVNNTKQQPITPTELTKIKGNTIEGRQNQVNYSEGFSGESFTLC